MSKLGSQLYGPGNLFERLFNQFLEIVQNRLKILSLELREEKINFIQIFILAMLVVALAVLSVVAVGFTAIYAIPAESRLLGLIIATGVFLIATFMLVRALVRKLSNYPIPFTDAISEMTRREK